MDQETYFHWRISALPEHLLLTQCHCGWGWSTPSPHQAWPVLGPHTLNPSKERWRGAEEGLDGGAGAAVPEVESDAGSTEGRERTIASGVTDPPPGVTDWCF